ncbi:hypothetical protein BDV95DRAFT_481101 [Massariosphaeria phaeospora]|uniref:Rhodopsin domain-containing protein n=1 Tax=Massariosphaeria phaeospora TaxID=100035 RepID=A0A7C8MMN9_9PLEO|nr:hypothetical protein BDV95DRAFT_481101 [Massariosphaeria phaeospora]
MAASIPNRGPELLAVDILFLAAAVIANLLRCYVRIAMVKAFGVDDWLMAIATLFFVAYCSSSISGVRHGTGRHHSDLSQENIHKAKQSWWLCYLFYCVSMISSKVSIGCFLLRIAVKRIHTLIIYGAMFISIVAGVVFFFVTLFQCHPIYYFWNKTEPGRCISNEVIIGLGYLYSTFSIISDFTFALLPGFIVWNLQLNRRTKIALVPLLTMGCIASSAVVARTPYLPSFRSADFLWATIDIAIWSSVEQGLAITAGSLATLRPLFHLIANRFGLSTNPTRPLQSNYAGASVEALGGRRKANQTELDLYKLSAMVETRVSRRDRDEEMENNIKSPNWFQTGFPRSKRNSVSERKPVEDTESQKSLHAKRSDESLDQDGMQITVSKSFFVTDERR